MLTNEYLKHVYEGLEKRNANEPEFLQAVREVLESIQPVVEKHPRMWIFGVSLRMRVRQLIRSRFQRIFRPIGMRTGADLCTYNFLSNWCNKGKQDNERNRSED